MKKLTLILILLLTLAAVSQAQVAVIAHKSVSESTIDEAKLKSIYLLKSKKWSDGAKIVVFNAKGTASEEPFYTFMGKSGSQLKKGWMRAQLTGEGTAPKNLKSDSEILGKVSSTAGAIGYISKSNVTDAVKVLMEIQ